MIHDTVGDSTEQNRAELLRPLSCAIPLEDLIAWLTSKMFGEAATAWLNSVVKTYEIRTSQDLLRLLVVKWPQLIVLEGREAALAWASKVVCEKFLVDASPRLFPYLAYETLLNRQPTPSEIKGATETEEKSLRINLLQHLLKSEEYRRSANRRAVISDGLETNVMFDMRRKEYVHIGYRIPKTVPERFFELGNDMDVDRVPLKGFVCARYDGTYNRLITDPNVSVIGIGIGDNRFSVARDWILLGPRVTLCPGDYAIVVDVAFEGDTEAVLDLVSAYGTKQHISLKFKETLKSIIPVRIDETVHAVELRLINLNNDSDVMHLNELGIYLRPEGRLKPIRANVATLPPAKLNEVVQNVARTPLSAAAERLARFFGQIKPQDALRPKIKFIMATKEFDPLWYSRQYPDVAGAGWDPLRHFVAHGMREGRLPNETFDPIEFVGSHPEYARSETAFLDYLRLRHPQLAKKYNLSQT